MKLPHFLVSEVHVASNAMLVVYGSLLFLTGIIFIIIINICVFCYFRYYYHYCYRFLT